VPISHGQATPGQVAPGQGEKPQHSSRRSKQAWEAGSNPSLQERRGQPQGGQILPGMFAQADRSRLLLRDAVVVSRPDETSSPAGTGGAGN